MANETHDDGAPLSDGDDGIADKPSTEALSVGGEEEVPAAAASGDRDAAVGLLLGEIRGLKQERCELLSERSERQVELSDTQAKLARTESELKEAAGRASRLEEQLRIAQKDLSAAKLAADRLEEQLRIAQDDLSAAKLAVIKHQDELHKLDSSVKNMQAMQVKINVLESTIKILEEELELSKQKQVDKDDKFSKRESELSAAIQELRSEVAAEKEKSLNSINVKDSKVPLMQSQALGAAAVVGAVALVAGAAAYLRLSKHR